MRSEIEWEDNGRSVDEVSANVITLAEKVRELHDTMREIMQFAFYLLFTTAAFSLVVIGVIRLRLIIG